MDIGDGVFDQFPLLSRDVFWYTVSFARDVDAIVTEYIHPTSAPKRRFVYDYVFAAKPPRDIREQVRESILRHDYDDDVPMIQIDDVNTFVTQAAKMGALKILYLFALHEEQAVQLFEHTEHEHVRAYLMHEYMRTKALWTKAIHDAALQAIERNDTESAMYYMYHNTDWSDAEQWAKFIISHDNVAMWAFFRQSFKMNDRVLETIVSRSAIDILTYIQYAERPANMPPFAGLVEAMSSWRGKDPSLLLLPIPQRDVLSDVAEKVLYRAATSSTNALYLAHAQYDNVKIPMPVDISLLNFMYLRYNEAFEQPDHRLLANCRWLDLTPHFQFLTYVMKGHGYKWTSSAALFILRQNPTVFFRALTVAQNKETRKLRGAFVNYTADDVPLDVWRYFYRTHLNIRLPLIAYALQYYKESEWDLQLPQNHVSLGYMLCIANATDNQLMHIVKKSNADTFEDAKECFIAFETGLGDFDVIESHYPRLIAMMTRYHPEWDPGFNNGAFVKAAIGERLPKTTASLLRLNSVREHYSIDDAVRDRQAIMNDPDNRIVDDDMIDVLTRYINVMRGEAEPDLKKLRAPIHN